MRVSSTRAPVLFAALCAALLQGCGGTSDSGTGGERQSTPTASAVRVVASTNVYGDIVRQVGGDRVSVDSIISDPAQDPHSYEASTRNQLALSKARVVIENGGGYDDFIGKMLRTANNASSTEVIDAVQVSGKTAPEGGELNEHVWYDLPTASRLADRIADALARADPAHGAFFHRNAEEFDDRLAPLLAEEARIKADHSDTAVAVTEPVPLYLIEASGLRDDTPAEFGAAVEDGTEVPANSMRQMLDLLDDKRVKALIYNRQTSGPQTERVKKAAADNGIPVVSVTETLPEGQDYVSWMKANVDALRKALGP
ncbi:zinc ABC transporter substrate-binding protein [Streptomyces sp. LX-29]|uniref:metal ABC transporter solute-binding protein, Zn/Mn family n=1 Tax=Streptomyces sp. LX-29 TaxID=2900152 RepID=UPI00240D0760|nr:zinc ABC transporter substrate-binding protein [Streptomyces sp. LX-29]WFB10483.1 zinc ABC transporter substrate-binding protein [Streptomyces sp. LX-29]